MDVGSSATKRSLLDLDPDYKDGHVSETKRRCLVEESGQEQAQQRVVEVVVRELDAALAQKESEVLQLQERVQTCQRDLHLLRFGITSSFFKQYLASDAPSSSLHSEEQNPVHPAVLRLMGISQPSGPKTRGVRYKSLTQGTSQESTDGVPTAKISKENELDEKKQKDNGEENQEVKNEPAPIKVPRYVPPNLPQPPEVCASSVRMERLRTKRRLVVGNVSKWLPEDLRENAATHKWMLYLRGPKDSPDISDIVAKVRYFLHPSYRPHDIVDVVHPFYLARRGWGEFPVRVQVHFVIQENRPIDIIHNLKLDRTYSGLQTLGGETVVDVWLKQESSMEDYNQNSGDNQEESHQPLDNLSESCNSDSDWHETVAHDNQETLVATAQVKTEQEEHIEEQKVEEIEIKKENVEIKVEEEECGDEDDEEEEEEEEDEEEEVEEGEAKETDGIQKPHLESKEISKTFVASSEKRFVLHILPDHDYLGSGSFSLKCTLCVEQNNSDGIKEKNSLKEEMIQVTSQQKESNWSSLVPPPLVLLQKSQEKIQTLPQNTVVSSIHRQISVKKEEIQGATNLDCAVPRPQNGFVSDSSLVQCVDAEGNLFYIRLDKPAKSGTQKGVLNSSMNVQMQHPTGGSIMNQVMNCSVEGKTDIKKNMVFQKIMGVPSSASFQKGRSLLKKNCITSVPLVSSDMKKILGSERHVECKPPVLGSSQSHLKEVPEEMDTSLKDAEQKVPRITNVQQAVIWILKQLPLADVRVNDPKFRRQHPYCAKSVDEFLSWPIGKRHCAERLRANVAHAILQKSDPSRFAKWTVRHIIKWSRLHALTPLPSQVKDHKEEETPPAIINTLISTVTEPSEVQDWLENVAEASKTAEETEIVDVEMLTPPSSELKISPSSEETANAIIWIPSDTFFGEFLRDTTAQVDIKLKPEMICPNVMYPAAEELLNRACQSLCEDLLRRSMSQAWSRCKKMPNEIVLNDVQNAILSRPEFSVFTNDGLGVQAYDPFIESVLQSYS